MPGDAKESFKFNFGNGDGDGTVNAESLGLCKKWSEEQQGEVWRYSALLCN